MQLFLACGMPKSLAFQSMHPIKDATSPVAKKYLDAIISIHAPYKGCNTAKCQSRLIAVVFQSMHPIKDATNRRRL